MNELEIRGLKDLIKEVIEDETDYKTRLDDIEEDIQELRGEKPDLGYEENEEDQEPDPDLPEEEPLEDNPEREVYEQNLEKAAQKESGKRLSKEDMAKLQKTPPRKVKPPVEKLDEEAWDEEQ